MTEYSRREMVKILSGGVAALGIGVKASAQSQKAKPGVGKSGIKVLGDMPISTDLKKVMFENFDLLNELVNEFWPRAQTMATQKAFWLAFNAWAANKLTESVMESDLDARKLGEYAWVIHASSYWGGVEFRKNWGLPPAFKRMGSKMPAASEVQAMIAKKLVKSFEIINSGSQACLEYLSEILHDDSTTGTIYTIAYNSGCQVVKTEDPPLGQRRPHRPEMPGAIRIYSRNFMRVDYDLPSLETPMYLKRWRSNMEKASITNTERFEEVMSGTDGQKDLRDIWKRGVEFGNISWGGDANDDWTQDYYDETVHWACVLGLGLEAIAQASLVASLSRDHTAAVLAVKGNAIFIGETFGWGVGMSDDNGKLPTISIS